MGKNKVGKVRVAVYIRIGGTGECGTAFEMQKAHFSKTISQNTDWELVEIYADLGADSRKQPNLGRLMSDCRAGRIDLVVALTSAANTLNSQANCRGSPGPGAVPRSYIYLMGRMAFLLCSEEVLPCPILFIPPRR